MMKKINEINQEEGFLDNSFLKGKEANKNLISKGEKRKLTNFNKSII